MPPASTSGIGARFSGIGGLKLHVDKQMLQRAQERRRQALQLRLPKKAVKLAMKRLPATLSTDNEATRMCTRVLQHFFNITFCRGALQRCDRTKTIGVDRAKRSWTKTRGRSHESELRLENTNVGATIAYRSTSCAVVSSERYCERVARDARGCLILAIRECENCARLLHCESTLRDFSVNRLRCRSCKIRLTCN